MQLIGVPLEHVAGLWQRLDPTPFFETLFRARSGSDARARGSEENEIRNGTLIREVNAAIASSREELRAAGDLVLRRYARRGYIIDARAVDAPPPGASETSAITLIASDAAGDAVGTLTLGLDGPDGMLVDAVYGAEVDAVRVAGGRVCELTRLAVDRRTDSGEVLAALFGLAFLLIRALLDATDVFIEVNPRHVAFYKRALGFAVEASDRFCERVKAPSVLLHLEIERLEQRLRSLGFSGVDAPLVGA